MLVLSRRLDESVTIADRLTVTVLDITGNTVRLGFEGPKEIAIVRTELKAQDAQLAGQEVSPAPGRKFSPKRRVRRRRF